MAELSVHRTIATGENPRTRSDEAAAQISIKRPGKRPHYRGRREGLPHGKAGHRAPGERLRNEGMCVKLIRKGFEAGSGEHALRLFDDLPEIGVLFTETREVSAIPYGSR